MRSRINAWYVARRSPRAAIWSRTCVSTRATNRSSVVSATRRSRGRWICDDIEKDSIQPPRRSIIVPFNYPRSPPTLNTLHLYNLRPVITWYLSPVIVEILSRSCHEHRLPVISFFLLFVPAWMLKRHSWRERRGSLESDCGEFEIDLQINTIHSKMRDKQEMDMRIQIGR